MIQTCMYYFPDYRDQDEKAEQPNPDMCKELESADGIEGWIEKEQPYCEKTWTNNELINSLVAIYGSSMDANGTIYRMTKNQAYKMLSESFNAVRFNNPIDGTKDLFEKDPEGYMLALDRFITDFVYHLDGESYKAIIFISYRAGRHE